MSRKKDLGGFAPVQYHLMLFKSSWIKFVWSVDLTWTRQLHQVFPNYHHSHLMKIFPAESIGQFSCSAIVKCSSTCLNWEWGKMTEVRLWGINQRMSLNKMPCQAFVFASSTGVPTEFCRILQWSRAKAFWRYQTHNFLSPECLRPVRPSQYWKGRSLFIPVRQCDTVLGGALEVNNVCRMCDWSEGLLLVALLAFLSVVI